MRSIIRITNAYSGVTRYYGYRNGVPVRSFRSLAAAQQWRDGA